MSDAEICKGADRLIGLVELVIKVNSRNNELVLYVVYVKLAMIN